jgi:hypothetical protein
MSGLSRQQKAVVDREVQAMLEQSPAFRALPMSERSRIANSTAEVAAALAVQGAAAASPPPTRAGKPDPYAVPMAGPTPPFPPGGPMPPPPGTTTPTAPWRPDERFQAEGVSAGVTQYSRMVNEVNFPEFVSSLVKGTFNAVVDASIQQMKAYGEMVQGVAMSLNDFRDQTVDVGEGRRHLQQKYPNVFELGRPERPGEPPTLSVKDDFDDDNTPSFMKDFGLDEDVDLSDEGSVDMLVTAARTELARGRQQLLATTILMGINRIVVTDGRINAKIQFNFKAHDKVTRDGTVNDWDTQEETQSLSAYNGLVNWSSKRPVNVLVSTTTAHSDTSLEANAKLAGEVSLNFKSETFPLEKMFDSNQMMHLNQAQSGARGVPAQRPAEAAPPPTPAPAPAAPAAPGR